MAALNRPIRISSLSAKQSVFALLGQEEPLLRGKEFGETLNGRRPFELADWGSILFS